MKASLSLFPRAQPPCCMMAELLPLPGVPELRTQTNCPEPQAETLTRGRTFERLQQVLPHVPAGSFEVGKLSQAAQFQPSFHFVCSGSHSKELFSALSPEQAMIKEGEPTLRPEATPTP